MIQGQQPVRASAAPAQATAAPEPRVKFRSARHFVKVREVTWMTQSTYLLYCAMGHDIYMFTGVRYVKELLYHDLFQAWARKYPNFHYVPSISRPETPEWTGRKGAVQG